MAVLWGLLLIFLVTVAILALYHTITEWHDNPILTTYNIIQVLNRVGLYFAIHNERATQEPDGMHFPDIYLCHSSIINETLYGEYDEETIWRVTERFDQLFGDQSVNVAPNTDCKFPPQYIFFYALLSVGSLSFSSGGLLSLLNENITFKEYNGSNDSPKVRILM